jgi:hypothetical protein
VTVGPCSRLKPTIAVCGRLTAIRVPVGWIGWPTVLPVGKVAVTCALTGFGPEWNAQA